MLKQDKMPCTLEKWVQEQKNKPTNYVGERVTEADKPKFTLKERCVWLAKENKMSGVVKLLQQDNAELDQIHQIWQGFAVAFGFTSKWKTDTAIIDRWRGNKPLTFKTYKGENVTYTPKEYRKDQTPRPAEIVSFLYCFSMGNELADISIIECPKCNAIAPSTEYCRYCGEQLNPHTITIGNEWENLPYLSYLDKQINNI